MELRQNITELVPEQSSYSHYLKVEIMPRLLKRAFDISFSLLIMLPVFLLVCPMVALAVLLDSRGSLFFVQRRNGLHNKVFYCVKFRTMYPNDTAHIHAATQGDERITGVGKLLRSTGLDELPQWWNVLRGDMSIVGPRPHMIADNLRFEQFMCGYQERHRVKPGITGLAQINGFKGPAPDHHAVRQRIRMDLFYVRNQDFGLDMYIVMETIKQMAGELWKAVRK
jgi:putative colanic acid biosynthesis UDP-glucose lipid carrier transferase